MQVADSKIEMLQAGVNDRQRELQRVADILAKAANKTRRRGAIIRTMLIVLGAVTAAHGALDQLTPNFKDVSALTFLVVGILIAALAGIETAFRFESKGTELNSLAAACHSAVRQTDSVWHKQVGIEEDMARQVEGAMQLIELQDTRLSEVQERAAASGVNIALEVRRIYRSDLRAVSRYGDDDDDDDDDSDDDDVDDNEGNDDDADDDDGDDDDDADDDDGDDDDDRVDDNDDDNDDAANKQDKSSSSSEGKTRGKPSKRRRRPRTPYQA